MSGRTNVPHARGSLGGIVLLLLLTLLLTCASWLCFFLALRGSDTNPGPDFRIVVDPLSAVACVTLSAIGAAIFVFALAARIRRRYGWFVLIASAIVVFPFVAFPAFVFGPIAADIIVNGDGS